SNIFTLAITGLGAHTSQGASLLVMGILGGALIPLLQGWMADTIGLKPSFIIPAICYAYIAGYGLYCSRKLGVVKKSEPVAGGHLSDHYTIILSNLIQITTFLIIMP